MYSLKLYDYIKWGDLVFYYPGIIIPPIKSYSSLCLMVSASFAKFGKETVFYLYEFYWNCTTFRYRRGFFIFFSNKFRIIVSTNQRT